MSQLQLNQVSKEIIQYAALDIERTVMQLRGEKLITTVGLIKALGGGWQNETPASLISK